VWRDLVAWLFHSPRRLLLVILVPLIVTSLVSVLFSGLKQEAPQAPANQATNSPGADAMATGAGTPPLATAPPEAFDTVDSFVRIWLTGPAAETDEQVRAWHERLRAYVTPELAAALQHTDPARVPDATVAGPPVVLQAGDYLTEMSVPMSDGRDLNLTIAWDGQVWRVSDIEREGET
jgi:hypothetical protein